MTQHKTMRHPLYSFLLMFMATVSYGQCAHLRAAGAKSMELSSERVLFKTTTTSDCGNIHQEPFKGMLTLTYEYTVDTIQGAALDVATTEKALAQAVVSSLSACDSNDRPMYAIQLTTASHKIASQVSCDPAKAGNGCHVITGYTIILLDSNVSGAKALAYDAIVTGLANLAFMNEFAPNVASARFSKRVLDTFAMIPSNPKADGSQRQPATSAIAVVVASTMFLLASIFAFGTVRRRTQHQGEQELVSTPMAKSPHLGIKRADYHDGDLEPTLLRLSINNSDTPSTTWSISDLTSEGSTRSGFSRTTSTLEIIEEETPEDVDMHSDDPNEQIHDLNEQIHDLNEQIHEYGSSPRHTQPICGSGSRVFETFDAVDRRNMNQDKSPQKSMLSVITQSLSQKYNEDQDVHTKLPEALAAEEASPRPSQGSRSRCVDTFDAVDRQKTIEDNVLTELLLSIVTPSFSQGEDEDQDFFATLLEEMTAEEAELMLIGILSPLSANSSILAHDIESIAIIENEAAELDIPTENALEEKTTPSDEEGIVISSPGKDDDDDDDSEEHTPTECNPSADNCSAGPSEETTVAAPTLTGNDDQPTVSYEDMTNTDQPKQPVAKYEHSTEDNWAAISGDRVATSAKEDAILMHLGIAEARSFEDPIGTNMVGGDVSIDDSLALTAHTTDSDASLDGWIARFLLEWTFSEKSRRNNNEPAIPESDDL